MATFTAGTSFTDGVTGDVTASKLNALVANATPLANLITDRTAETSIATDDLVLISDTSESGALNKMTVANLMKAEMTGTINSTAGTIGTLNSTTGVIPTLTSTTLITSGTGTAASPAIVPTGDTNTGVLFPAADTVGISTGGSERVRVDSSGNVGIGTNSPDSKLSIQATGGIHIFGGTSNPGSGTEYPLIYGGTNKDYSAKISVKQTAASTDGLDLLFYTIPAGGSTTERLRIDSSGNVGIGTTSPSYKLDVTANTNGALVNASGAADNIGLRVSNTQTGGKAYRILAPATGSGYSAGSLVFEDQAVGARMTIDSSGRVGIGTSSPRGRFEASDAYLSGETGAQCIFPLSVTIGYGGSDYGSIGYNLDYRSATSNTAGVKYLATDTISQLDFNAGGFIFRNAPSGTSGNTATLTERLRITSGGEVYIAGTTDQGAYNLQVNGTGVWGAGAYVNGSDERLKENIQDITSGLDVVEKLRPVSFQYKEEYTADRSIQSGFVAQDLLVALEGKNYLEGVVSQGPTYYNVAYQNLIPILAKAIQELKAENDSLKTRITALEAA